jgi:hypothetical protein
VNTAHAPVRQQRADTALAFLQSATLTDAERNRLHPLLWWDFAEHGVPRPSTAVLRGPTPDVPTERMVDLLRACGYPYRMAVRRMAITSNDRTPPKRQA